MTEQWKPVVGFEDTYEVSSMGRVRSMDRYVAAGHKGKGTRFVPGKMLSPRNDGHGYNAVDLRSAGQGKPRYPAKIYRLVAEAFIGLPPTPRHAVNHINGIKRDDRVENLEWVTHAENLAHAVRTGLVPRGASRAKSKTNEDEVRQMREMRLRGERLQTIAEKFGLAISTVCQIVNGTWWKHAPLADAKPLPTREWTQGEKSNAAKLTESSVLEIRKLYATGKYTQRQLGKMFGVTNVSISSIVLGKTWKHVEANHD